MEQHVRDNRINMIYEGTNTIQSLDLLGRKVLSQQRRHAEEAASWSASWWPRKA